MAAWTQKDIDRLAAKGMVVVDKGKVKSSLPKELTEKREPVAMQHIFSILNKHQVDYETEHRFHKVRKFRFDIAVPHMMLAVEYEGLMSEKSRHTTITGFTNDCRKYNMAQLAGWKVLRYSALNYTEFENDLLTVLSVRQ